MPIWLSSGEFSGLRLEGPSPLAGVVGRVVAQRTVLLQENVD